MIKTYRSPRIVCSYQSFQAFPLYVYRSNAVMNDDTINLSEFLNQELNLKTIMEIEPPGIQKRFFAMPFEIRLEDVPLRTN